MIFLITQEDLLDAIRECESSSPSLQLCEKLACLYTVYDHLYGDFESNYSYQAEPLKESVEVIGDFGDSDFLTAVGGKEMKEVFVVLDEMNLSQVEYYFSDFLSKIDTEGKWKISLIDDSAMNDYNTGQNIRAEEENRVPNKLKNGKLIVPENIWFIGTANKDSSTKEISDKVYDRAQVIYFKEMAPKPQGEHPAINPEPVSFESLKQWFGQCEQVNFDTTELKNYLKIFDIFYGFRIQKQIQQFVNIYCSLSQDTRESAMQKAIDYQLSTKILRKMEWMDFSFVYGEIKADSYEQNNYTKSEKKLEKIIEDVPDDGTGGNN